MAKRHMESKVAIDDDTRLLLVKDKHRTEKEELLTELESGMNQVRIRLQPNNIPFGDITLIVQLTNRTKFKY
jgi:hypothetical protein